MNILLDIINEEETEFLKTWSLGQLMETNDFRDVACRLYDKYGIPYDLTQLICEESGLDKTNKAKLLAQAMEDCKLFVENNPTAKKVIKQFKIGGEAKSLNDIMKFLKQSLPEAFVLLHSIDDLNNKILCLSFARTETTLGKFTENSLVKRFDAMENNTSNDLVIIFYFNNTARQEFVSNTMSIG